jgi:YidC/Oxa1 family membrane protein insertase
MAKMKALQPEMQRLKDLHKDDKQKIQMEMMNLYKREKVNPISGCLPVLIQIPFFFAIYKMLFVTIEMRHAPFYGWIKDLSAADPTTIFNLFGLIPWNPPSFLIIGAWPIIMGVTMYIQQKLNPSPPDPIQAKIFMFFPFFLTILLASFPSGLVIYWSINNILTMAQQYVIIRKTKIKTV